MRSGGIDVAGLPVTVMGLGLFGGGATVARHLARRGARVTVTDQRNAQELAPALREIADLDLRLVLGEHRTEDFTRTGLVVANPAVSPRSPYLTAAREAGVPITSETALFLESCDARVIAVTGTQGKSSTCNTLHQLLVRAGLRAHLGGNIGRSLLEEAEVMQRDDLVVLEVSSYQLEMLPPALGRDGERPRVDAVSCVNVLADHLERHGTLEAYAAAKERIVELVRDSGGCAVLPADDPWTRRWNVRGARRVDAWLTTPATSGLHRRDGAFHLDDEELGHVDELQLPGAFQRANTLISLGLARLAGASPQALRAAVPELRALPHRLESLGLFEGHRVVDNGVSTTPDSTISAVRSMNPGFTVLMGGKPKSLPLDELVETCRGRARRIIVFGAAGEAFAAPFREAGIDTSVAPDVRGAVELAFATMLAGEELLFSPACASFDAYLNFRERALDFRAALPRDAENAQAPRPGFSASARSLDGVAGRGYS